MASLVLPLHMPLVCHLRVLVYCMSLVYLLTVADEPPARLMHFLFVAFCLSIVCLLLAHLVLVL